MSWKDKKNKGALFYMVKISDKKDMSSLLWKGVVKAKKEKRASVFYPKNPAKQAKLLPGVPYYVVVEVYNKKNEVIATGDKLKIVPSVEQ